MTTTTVPTGRVPAQVDEQGGEEQRRIFWGGVLGVRGIDGSPGLAALGGCWFTAGALEVPLGVEQPFAPAGEVHPACSSTASASWLSASRTPATP